VTGANLHLVAPRVRQLERGRFGSVAGMSGAGRAGGVRGVASGIGGRPCGHACLTRRPPLREMTEIERLEADYGGTGVTIGRHPMALRRADLARAGVTRACDLTSGRPGSRVRVAGSVIVRQRPGTPRASCSKPGGRPTLGRSCRKWPIRHPSTSPPMSGRPSPRFRSLRMGPRLRGSRDAAGRRAARGARPQACPLGIGTRGGRSRGAGSGSRLRLWMCDCGVKVRVASDDFRAECQRCGSAFTRAIPTGTPAAAEAAR
jgi:hypothetical protein